MGDFIAQVKGIITMGEVYDLAAGGQIIFTQAAGWLPRSAARLPKWPGSGSRTGAPWR